MAGGAHIADTMPKELTILVPMIVPRILIAWLLSWVHDVARTDG